MTTKHHTVSDPPTGHVFDCPCHQCAWVDRYADRWDDTPTGVMSDEFAAWLMRVAVAAVAAVFIVQGWKWWMA